MKDTAPYTTWRYYGEQTRDNILAYAVKITGMENSIIKGNLYQLDFQQHFKRVMEQALPADTYTLIYEHGERTHPRNSILTVLPTRSLESLNALKRSPTTRTLCAIFYKRNSAGGSRSRREISKSISPPCMKAGLKRRRGALWSR